MPPPVLAGSEEDVIEIWDTVSIASSSSSSSTQQPDILQVPSDPNAQDLDTQDTEDTVLDTQQDIHTQKEETCE